VKGCDLSVFQTGNTESLHWMIGREKSDEKLNAKRVPKNLLKCAGMKEVAIPPHNLQIEL
jgi:hypothetical protein